MPITPNPECDEADQSVVPDESITLEVQDIVQDSGTEKV